MHQERVKKEEARFAVGSSGQFREQCVRVKKKRGAKKGGQLQRRWRGLLAPSCYKEQKREMRGKKKLKMVVDLESVPKRNTFEKGTFQSNPRSTSQRRGIFWRKRRGLRISLVWLVAKSARVTLALSGRVLRTGVSMPIDLPKLILGVEAITLLNFSETLGMGTDGKFTRKRKRGQKVGYQRYLSVQSKGVNSPVEKGVLLSGGENWERKGDEGGLGERETLNEKGSLYREGGGGCSSLEMNVEV